MPIVTEHSEPKKRRAPSWVLALVLLVVPVGLFTWSFYRPVVIDLYLVKLYFGRRAEIAENPPLEGDWRRPPWGGFRHYRLPGGEKSGWYLLAWSN